MSKVPREQGGYELVPAEQVDFVACAAYRNPTAGWLAFNESGAAGRVGACLGEGGDREGSRWMLLVTICDDPLGVGQEGGVLFRLDRQDL